MFGELPYIFFIALATYLAFEYWSFPDLTIEGSFIAGMAITAYIFRHELPLFLIFPVSLLVVAFYSSITFMLHWLEMPPLLSGLLTLFIAFATNYFFNHYEIAVPIYDPIHYKPFGLGLNTSETFWWIGFGSIFIVSPLIILLERTRLGAKMRLSRNTPSRLVAKSARLNTILLWYCMIVFNFTACIGGILKGLSDNFSGIEMFGLITPGLACMFIVKLLKHLYSTPKTRVRALEYSRQSNMIVLLTDKIGAIIVLLLVAAVLLTLIRYSIVATGFAVDTSIINAITGIMIIALWVTFHTKKIYKKLKELL